MIILGGPVRWGALQRDAAKIGNAGVVTLTGADTAILTTGELIASLGDLVVITFSLTLTKGAVLGDVVLSMDEGTAPASWSFGINTTKKPSVTLPSVPALAVVNYAATWICEVQAIGLAHQNVRLYGTSAGSNSSIAISDAQAIVYTLRK